MVALDIAALGPQEAFAERMERMVTELKAVPPAEGFDEVFYPGELEARNKARQLRDGLVLPDQTRLDLMEVAREYGVTLPDSW